MLKNFVFHFFVVLFLLSCKSEKNKEERYKIDLIEAPSSLGSSLPYLVKGEDGYIYMSWVEKMDSINTVLKYSKHSNGEWSSAQLIASGDDWFVNWADYPMIAIDNQGNMLANYLVKSTSDTYSYDINLILKPADSNEWGDPIIPHSDGTTTEHGFVTLLPQNDGTFLLGWLDGRNTAGGTHDNPAGSMTIRSAVIDMKGNLTEEVELDDRTCDCCQTGGVITSDGAIIAYRDKTEFEIRDICFVRRVEGEWTSPKIENADNWEVAGCPVNGPRLAAIENTVSIAWFTAANGIPKVKFAFSNNAGESFDPSLEIASTNTAGRVDVIMTDASTAYVSWLSTSDSLSVIVVRKVSLNGESEEPIVVAKTSASRASGFPQMEYVGKKIILGWTDVENDLPKIKMASISVESN